MNFSKKQNAHLQCAWFVLLMTYGILFIVVGIDKFFNNLVDWQSFVSPSVQEFFPFCSQLIIRLFAIVQIMAGLLLLYSRSRYAVYCILMLLTFIFFNIWSIDGLSTVLIHDVCMVIHCIVLVWLTDAINLLKKGRSMNISNNAYSKVLHSWWLLKITYGLLFVIAGADKFMHLVTDWDKYLSPWITQYFPLTLNAHQFMLGVGIIEIIIGLLVLTKFTKLGAYLVAAWLVIIVINLLSMGTYFDIAVRDIVMAIGAYVLAQLTDVHEEFTDSARS